MLQLQVLRQDPEAVKKKLEIKYFNETQLVDFIISLDDQRKKLQLEFDNTQAKVNSISKEIGQLMSKGQKDEATARKEEVASLKTSLDPISAKLADIEKQLQDELVKLPNLPSDKVPNGKTSAENVVLKEGGNIPVLPQGSVPHWDLIKTYDLVDFETGAKITGSGFPLYKGRGAKLQRALVQYFLDFNTTEGYTEYLPPFMVNEASAFGTGQLPDKEGQMYHMPADNFYMIPTSEVPVTNIYRDEILKESALPNTTIISDNLPERINEIRQQEGSEILLFGSPTATHALMEQNLIDGFWLFVDPIIFGQGIPLFKNVQEITKLQLVSSKTFSCGVVCLHYKKI